MELQNYRKKPPHILMDNEIYFITARTRNFTNFFKQHACKKIFKTVLQEAVKKYHSRLYAWVINNNHYHILIGFEKGFCLAGFIRFLHGKTARLLNKRDGSVSQKIFQNYWERAIRSEKDFYTRLNYIHQNPIKHGLMSSLDELAEYEFCSYKDYLEDKGKDWLTECFERYPVIDCTKEDVGLE